MMQSSYVLLQRKGSYQLARERIRIDFTLDEARRQRLAQLPERGCEASKKEVFCGLAQPKSGDVETALAACFGAKCDGAMASDGCDEFVESLARDRARADHWDGPFRFLVREPEHQCLLEIDKRSI